LAVLVLQSADPKYDAFFLANYATVRLVDDIRRLPGLGDAYIFGQQNYSMSVVVDPVRMAQLSLTPSDIVNVVREQNRDFPAGLIGREATPVENELTVPIITRGRFTEVKDFEEMIVLA